MKDVTKVLAEAWEAVERAGIPETLHPVAFEQAVRLIAGPATPAASAPPPATTPLQTVKKPKGRARSNGQDNVASDAADNVPDEDAFFHSFASESGIDAEALRRVYFVNKEGRARIGLSKSKLGSTEAERNRAVATLLAGRRWYVEGKQSVGIGEIRDAAQAIPYEVSRNLAAHIQKVPGTLTVGSGDDKAVRVQTDKFNAPFRETIERMTAD